MIRDESDIFFSSFDDALQFSPVSELLIITFTKEFCSKTITLVMVHPVSIRSMY